MSQPEVLEKNKSINQEKNTSDHLNNRLDLAKKVFLTWRQSIWNNSQKEKQNEEKLPNFWDINK